MALDFEDKSAYTLRNVMRCERCNKTITEQTVRIYDGRCVPCHRRRPSQRLPLFFGGVWFIIVSILLMPYWIVRGLIGMVRRRLTPLPFTRGEVLAIIEPVHGRAAARQYFAGMREGFLRGAYHVFDERGLSRFFYSLGMGDGECIQHDSSQWPARVQSRASERFKKFVTKSCSNASG